MPAKIRYATDRGGEYKEFTQVSQLIIMPNDDEYNIRWCEVTNRLIITQIWGNGISVEPMVSNQIGIKSKPE